MLQIVISLLDKHRFPACCLIKHFLTNITPLILLTACNTIINGKQVLTIRHLHPTKHELSWAVRLLAQQEVKEG